MSWSNRLTDSIADGMRYAAACFIQATSIVLAGFVFWFVTRFILRLMGFLSREFFGSSW